MPSAEAWIDALGLEPHPEGGRFREVYRAAESTPASALPERFATPRAHATSIYFLLSAGEFSALHRIRQDELWHFYDGDGLVIHQLDEAGTQHSFALGRDLEGGQRPHTFVPAGVWFGAEVVEGGRFALVGCTVAPGFDFEDLELADRADLLARHPGQRALIERLTR